MSLVIVLILIVFPSAGCDVCEDSRARTCDECVVIHPNCVWLVDNNVTIRCVDEAKKPSDVRNIKYGGANDLKVIINEDFRLPTNDQPAVQIRPQKLKLRLRRGESVKFQLSYKALKDYPLDIYYLVDQTNTMREHIEGLQKLSKTLPDDLYQLTKDYQIAFGYYSDKILMPYNAMVPKLLENPCAMNGNRICAPGSNFMHALNFTNDTVLFFEQVADLYKHFTANLDNLEGGLDALLQILVCDSFGWRMHSRKMVLIATDGLLHSAGDGILGGAVRRASPQCIMRRHDDNRLVYNDLNNDYPSVEEIYRLLIAKKVTMLLAIESKNDTEEYYKSLRDLLHEVSFLSFQQSDNTNSNISAALRDGFMDAVKKVQFQVIDQPKYLKFDVATTCDGKQPNYTWGCWNVILDHEYTFNVTVTLTDVPPHKTDRIRIEEKHLHEVLEIEIEYAEKCDCEDSKDGPIDNKVLHGTYACGVYKCHAGWVGEFCDQMCDPSKAKYGSESSVTCSGHGDFDSNLCQCQCDKQFAGEFCQTECGISKDGIVCAGNGVCTEKGCACNKGFTGDNCNCTLRTDTCFKDGSTEMCENHGICECGQCKCSSQNPDFKYTGNYCQLCLGCNDCPFNDIIIKYVNNKDEPEEHRRYTFINIKSTTDLQCTSLYSPNSSYECTVYYRHSDKGTTIIEYDNKCKLIPPLTTAQLGIRIFGIISLILLMGVVLILIWKITVTIKDRREYARFEEGKQLELMTSNQIYDDPVRMYKNPWHKQE